MPQFANPWLLLLALLVPPLLWWWLRQRRQALRHPAADLLVHLPTGRARLARGAGAALRGTSLLLLVVAVSGPRWPDLHTRIDTEGIAIMMLVDVSGSMGEKDFDWNGEPVSRLEAVRRVFRLFVAGGKAIEGTADGGDATAFEGRANDLIGLVTFATRPETACPLTLSHSVLLRLLDQEKPRTVPGESETNISDGIALGLHRLKSAGPRRKVLVLLTDGEHNVRNPQSGWLPLQAGAVAASLKVPIYTIDAGNVGSRLEEGGAAWPDSPSRAPAGPDSESQAAANRAEAVHILEELARLTGGRNFQARDTAGLLAACRGIDEMERADIHSFQYRRYYEGYPWFGLTSFLIYCLMLSLEMTVWRRLP
jgi:Ca-activated chloride channel family protein